MINRHLVLFLCMVFVYPVGIWGQSRVVENQLLVQLKGKNTPESLLHNAQQAGFQGWTATQQVASAPLNIWLLEHTQGSDQSSGPLLTWLKKQPTVQTVQHNHYVQERNSSASLELEPNDPDFSFQWYLNNTGQSGGLPGADLGAPAAWEITTGGNSPAGDTVVVAVIDGGLCPYCPELSQNLWVNHQEIPNDGVDNDGNGYFDDYKGWNVNEQNDNIIGSSSAHGTSVAGIIAARGNNHIGISGILWDTKLMFVAGTSGTLTTESQILGAFEYVLKARKSYNETNGAKGAFVVAVNCSFGIDYGTPDQSPLWCDMIQQLGEVGILTVAATSNGNWDVDEYGDMPSTCPTDYLISVTSLDHFDEKVNPAAWGSTSVDIGAYGEDIYTTKVGTPVYGQVSGTSFAAPQVTGALGLLYTAPCPNLITLAKENPDAGALWAKNVLLNAAMPNASLQNITTTGGRLQLHQLLSQYESNCTDCPVPYSLSVGTTSTNTALLEWIESGNFTSIDLRWRIMGDTAWTVIDNVQLPWELTGLSTCQMYEFAARAHCSDSLMSTWSGSYSFTTDGCCVPPSSLQFLNQESDTVQIQWQPVTAAQYYRIRYKPVNATNWSANTIVYTPNTSIFNVEACTNYEVQVQSQCDTGFTAFSNSLVFKTSGCGACYDRDYCLVHPGSASEEWIQQVELGGFWSHESYGYQGYQNFSGQEEIPLPELQPGMEFPATVTPAFQGVTYNEMFRIYVDFNLDGDFTDDNELVFDPGYATSSPVTAAFSVPWFNAAGITRMRVMMKFTASGFLFFPEPCEDYEYGQVEDYCVVLNPNVVGTTSASTSPTPTQSLRCFPNPVQDDMRLLLPETLPNSQVYLSLTDISGQVTAQLTTNCVNNTVEWPNLNKIVPGMYMVTCEMEDGRIFRGKMIKI